MASSATSVEEDEEVKDEEQVTNVSGAKVSSGVVAESEGITVNEEPVTHLAGSKNTSCVLHGLPDRDRRLLAVSLDTKVATPLRPAHDPKKNLTVVLEDMGHCNFKLLTTGVVDSDPERDAAEGVTSISESAIIQFRGRGVIGDLCSRSKPFLGHRLCQAYTSLS